MEFSSASCFQRDFAVRATISVAVRRNLSTWKEKALLGLNEYFEQLLEIGVEMFKISERN